MKKLPKGFTLIELLIVIAVIGVLAAAVWTALDPLDKIDSANDSKVQSDIGFLGQAVEAYATAKSGYYPDDTAPLTALFNNGDLKSATFNAPTNYDAYAFYAPAGCLSDGTSGCARIVACGELKAKKFITSGTGRKARIYSSASGKACDFGVTADATGCTGQLVAETTTCP